MLSIPIRLDEWIEQGLPPAPIPGYIRGPYQHQKDNLGSLEPIFKMLLDPPKVTGFTQRLFEKTNIRRSTLSTWRINLLRDPAWRPMRHHYVTAHRVLTDDQERELATYIASEYIDPGFRYTDADFKIDAPRFYQRIVCKTEGEMSESELTNEQMREIESLTASSKFIQAFGARNRLSLRRPSFTRRPKATTEDMGGSSQKCTSSWANSPGIGS
jgi:hypothetical protein